MQLAVAWTLFGPNLREPTFSYRRLEALTRRGPIGGETQCRLGFPGRSESSAAISEVQFLPPDHIPFAAQIASRSLRRATSDVRRAKEDLHGRVRTRLRLRPLWRPR